MTRREHLHRVVRLSLHCTRNLAYYRAGWRRKHLIQTENQFWRTVNGNCLDQCVLEWCKLFGSPKNTYHWKKIVADPTKFETDLLRNLAIDTVAFQKYINEMRHYRDKFVAHLDSERVMNIPNLDIAKKSTFYLVRVVTSEATPEELSGCEPYMDLSLYYNVSEDEAKQIYGTLDDS